MPPIRPIKLKDNYYDLTIEYTRHGLAINQTIVKRKWWSVFEPVYWLGFFLFFLIEGFLRPFSDRANALLALLITLAITLLALVTYKLKLWGLVDQINVLINPRVINIKTHLDNLKEETEEIVTDGNMCFFLTRIGNLAATPSLTWAKFVSTGNNHPEILNNRFFTSPDQYDGTLLLEANKEKYPFYNIYYKGYIPSLPSRSSGNSY